MTHPFKPGTSIDEFSIAAPAPKGAPPFASKGSAPPSDQGMTKSAKYTPRKEGNHRCSGHPSAHRVGKRGK